jgi:hypothetical protein
MRDKKKYAREFFAELWVKNLPETIIPIMMVRIPIMMVRTPIMIRYAKELGTPIITATQPPVTLVPQSPKNKLLSS